MFVLVLKLVKSQWRGITRLRSAVRKAEERVLKKFGAFVRTTARRSIRKRKGISSPGSPPSSHTHLLRDFILFAYDASTRSVVIGPILLPSKMKSGINNLVNLEYGGTGKTTWGRWGGAAGRPTFYRARPSMRPAFAKEVLGLPKMWNDSIK